MSHGLGMMQHLLLTTLSRRQTAVAALHRRYLEMARRMERRARLRDRCPVCSSFNNPGASQPGKAREGQARPRWLWLPTETRTIPKETAYHEAATR